MTATLRCYCLCQKQGSAFRCAFKKVGNTCPILLGPQSGNTEPIVLAGIRQALLFQVCNDHIILSGVAKFDVLSDL